MPTSLSELRPRFLKEYQDYVILRIKGSNKTDAEKRDYIMLAKKVVNYRVRGEITITEAMRELNILETQV